MIPRVILAWVVCFVLGCSNPFLLDLTIVVPEGPDPLSGVDHVRLGVSNPVGEDLFEVVDPRQLQVEIEIDAKNTIGTVFLEGFSGGELVARGETPPLLFEPSNGGFSLLVASVGVSSVLRPRLESAGKNMLSILLMGMGLLLVGGETGEGRLLDSAVLYDFFDHRLIEVEALPEKRKGAVAAVCGAGCGVVFLGEKEDGSLANSLMRFDGNGWKVFADDLAPGERRKDASTVLLPDGNYLVLGGVGVADELKNYLLLEPGADVTLPKLRVFGAGGLVSRTKPAVAATNGSTVLVAGGQKSGEIEAELYFHLSGSVQRIELPGPDLADGAAAVALDDGRIVLVGGRDESGQALRDAWVVETASGEVKHLPQTLAQGRFGLQIVGSGETLVVIGGFTDTGLAPQVEFLATKDLSLLRETPLQVPRASHVVEPLSPGSLLVVGGADASDTVKFLELCQTQSKFDGL
ncbi:MAG: kelch repeat-containing protein [Pseudomonadota bacterium]